MLITEPTHSYLLGIWSLIASGPVLMNPACSSPSCLLCSFSVVALVSWLSQDWNGQCHILQRELMSRSMVTPTTLRSICCHLSHSSVQWISVKQQVLVEALRKDMVHVTRRMLYQTQSLQLGCRFHSQHNIRERGSCIFQ